MKKILKNIKLAGLCFALSLLVYIESAKASDMLMMMPGFYGGSTPAAPAVVGYDIGPQPYLTLNSVQFPRTLEDATVEQTVYLKNTGTSSATFTGYSGNTVFGISASTGVLAPGQQRAVTVTFSPVSGTADFVTEIVTFVVGGVNVPMRVSGSKVTTGQSTSNYGGGGTLSVTASNTKYVLTADVTQIAYTTADISNTTVDMAGFDCVYSSAHGVVHTVATDHCELTDSVGGSQIRQSGTTGGLFSIYHGTNTANANDFYINGGIECIPAGLDGIGHDMESSQCPTGLTVDGLVITGTSTTITNRHALDGALFKCDRALSNGDAFVQIRNVTATAGCQGGVHCNATRYQIVDCEIHHTSTYTNGFGLYVYGPYGQAWNNIIGDGVTEISGRGILVNKSNSIVFDNSVIVQQDRYEGADSNGICYGGQIDPDGNDVDNIYFFDNDITVKAISNGTGDYGGHGIKMTGVGVNSTNIMMVNNNVTMTRVGAASNSEFYALAVAPETNPQTTGIMANNTCITDGGGYYTPWRGCVGVTFKDNSFTDGANLFSTRYYFYSGYGADNGLITIVFDNDDISGATFDYTDMYIRAASEPGAVSVTVQHEVTIQIEDSSDSSAISGATVVVDDSQATEVVNTTTNASGLVVADLVDFIVAGPDSDNLTTTNYTPHSADISASGYTASNGNSIDSDSEKTVTIQLTAS